MLSPLAALAAEPLCGDAVGAAEQRYNVPSGLLQAIALSESGRWDKQARVTVAWPWAVTSGADSFFAPDKQSAIATVRRLQREGRRNIDVGCMQVNLMHHPDAFADLDSAFDPEVNAGYGARFLSGLREATRSWSRAVERYHSADPDRGRSYRDRVYDRWHAVQKAGSAVIGPGVRGTTVHRPPLREAAAASSLFSNAGPRWRLTPVRIGQSLWSDRPAMPLVMRGRPLAPLGKRPTTPKAPSAGG
ncbi:MAG TPA: transglycosylase SLT domain-containing protein [Geminicoccaceae bacterium]|nr:transglycosylase SLT domain-containing protein [Geminicoccus sp.]HMU50620.1 transglycosylase SLT domain-containing protein [Geminicoccaceae bacterium]